MPAILVLEHLQLCPAEGLATPQAARQKVSVASRYAIDIEARSSAPVLPNRPGR